MEESLRLAKKVGVASVVVDVLLAYQKDELATMTANSRDWFSALRNSNSKWRNDDILGNIYNCWIISDLLTQDGSRSL